MRVIKKTNGKTLAVAIMASLMLAVSGAAGAQESGANVKSGSLELIVRPGAKWKSNPQFAAWITTADGAFVKPIAVSAKAGKKKWFGNPKGGRPDSLPVWYHISALAPSVAVDAATSATPKAGVSAGASVDGLIPGKAYRVRLEVNASFDYNETWPKKAKEGDRGYSGVNGQPSIVYEAEFVAGKAGSARLVPIGTGSIDGSHGDVSLGFAGLTTALAFVESAEIIVK